MFHLLLIGVGGFIGSVSRYALSMGIGQLTPGSRFPLGTMVVNILGCLLIGLLAGVNEKHLPLSQEARLLLMTGLLGGFTTFSAFGLETITLLRRNEWVLASSYVLGSVILGLAAVWLGMKLMLLLPRT
jgi:CrcB protein